MPTPYREYVYLIGSANFCWYKIGKSTRIEVRLNEIGVLLPFKIEVIAVWETVNCSCLESFLHTRFSEKRINGEWFSFDRFDIGEVLEGAYPWSAKIVAYRGDASKLSSFSNIEEDKKISRLGPYKELREKLAKQRAAEWLHANGLKNTKENRQLASKATSQDAKTEFERIINQRDIHAANRACANMHTVAQELEYLRRAKA